MPQPTVLRDDVDLVEWEQRHDVLRALEHLPPRQRQVLAWTIDGYTPTEIAAELRMTPETVRASLYQARIRIARYVDGGDGGE